jgi:hypothetical protein
MEYILLSTPHSQNDGSDKKKQIELLRSCTIDEKGTLKATENDKYENIAGSV